MIRASGQVLHGAARVVHFIMVIAMGLLIAASVILTGLAVRLSMGPINARTVFHDAPFTLSLGTAVLSFDGFTLAWEGFHRGVGLPIDFRLVNIAVIDAAGRHRIEAREARLSLSLNALLHGRLVPRGVEMDDGLVTVTRGKGGTFNLGLSSAAEPGDPEEAGNQPPDLRAVLDGFVRGTDGLGQLDGFRLHNFGVTLHDERLDRTWQAAGAEVDLRRLPSGAIVGSAHVPLILGGEHAELTAALDLPRDANGHADASLSAIQPSVIAEAVPALAPVTALEAPVSLRLAVTLDPGLMPIDAKAYVGLGTGRIDMGTGSLPIRDGAVTLSATPDRLVIENARITLPASRPAGASNLSFTGTVQRAAARLTASVNLAVDQLDVADLPVLWPRGTGGGARPWVLQNVTAGTVSHIAVSVVAEAGEAMSDIVLTKASGDLDADDATIAWLDHVPPIEHARVHLHLQDPDRLVLAMPSGRQRISRDATDLPIQDGQMLITGLSAKDQSARITLHTEGPVPSALSLLQEPRLHLFNKESLNLKDPAGDTSVNVMLEFPLDANLQADQIVFHVGARLERVHLSSVVAGRDINGGAFDLTADKDGLGIKGQALLATIPIQATGSMTFNGGPPGQILQRIAVTASPTVEQLAAAGVDTHSVLVLGSIPMTAVVTERRGGEGAVALNADLSPAALQVKLLGWAKPTAVAASAAAVLVLSHDRLTSISHITADADDLAIRASADCPDGVIRAISLERARLGTTDMHGTIGMPANLPVDVVLSGPRIDLSSQLQGSSSDHSISKTTELPDWSLSARFDRVILANEKTAGQVTMQGRSRDGYLRFFDLNGSLAPHSSFAVRIDAATGDRHLSVDAADAGGFLAGAGLTRVVRSGHLVVNGDFDDKLATRPLAGTLRIDDARLVDAPVLGKVLQAMTLYGVSDLLSGPGIGISRMLIPFGYEQQHLRLVDGRVFSSSLGLTVKGVVDLGAGRLALSGTVVPAYVINSVLGRIPYVGKLFSPEVGGGLFAARYTVDGPFSNATVAVNPLSVLTPGFLRDLFDIGGPER